MLIELRGVNEQDIINTTMAHSWLNLRFFYFLFPYFLYSNAWVDFKTFEKHLAMNVLCLIISATPLNAYL